CGSWRDCVKTGFWKVTADAERYRRFGILPEATRAAMVQCYEKDELRPERLEELLACAGFQTVDIRFRWLPGQAQLRDRWGERTVAQLEEYLTMLLPLTRHLFKNLMVIAN